MKKAYLLGVASALVLIGCAGFSYHYYGLSEVSYDRGILLGPKPKDDMPFSQCAPTDQNRHPCVVMFTKDFWAFRLDYDDVKQKLIDCQKGH